MRPADVPSPATLPAQADAPAPAAPQPSQPAPPAGPVPPWWRDGRVWLLLAITALSLVVGWQWKAQCHERDWDGYQWREFCYSDVQALYGTRGASDGEWPYLDVDNEYPPVTGLYMHLMAQLTDGRTPYIAASAAGFSLLALVTTVLLAELVGRDRRVLYWAMAPALVLYAFYNWDMLAVAPAVGALLAFRRGHPLAAGLLLGLGASAKLFPAFLAPALGLWILRRDRGLRRDGLSFGLGFAGAWLAIHLPLALLDLDGLVRAYTFQTERGPNFESLWFAVAHLGRTYGSGFLAAFGDKAVYEWGSLVPLAAALAVSGWAAFTRRLDPVAAAVLPVLVFLAVNKVYSVQYTLWAIPLLVVVPVPRTLKALVVVADLAVLLTLGTYFALSGSLADAALFTPVAIAVLFRAGVWAACAGLLVRRAVTVRPLATPTAHPEATA